MANFEDKTRDELERNLVEAYERLVRAGRHWSPALNSTRRPDRG